MKIVTLIKGMGVGAGLMYFFDPDRGNRRRALVRDQLIHTVNEVGDAIDVGTRDLNNRLCGVFAEARGLLSMETASDEILVQRVRSKLGHVVSHPGAIEV